MVDVTRQIEAVERTVRAEEVDGAEAYVQTLAQEYASPLDDVWDAITDPERIPRWFLPVSGDLRLGGRYRFEGNAGGEVLECAPPADSAAHFRVTWEFGGGVTWLTVRLTSTGSDATRLELEHTARAGDIPPGFWEQFGPGATGVGWDGGLLGLALHLAQDASPPPRGGAGMGPHRGGEVVLPRGRGRVGARACRERHRGRRRGGAGGGRDLRVLHRGDARLTRT